jgi:hypothetical protein
MTALRALQLDVPTHSVGVSSPAPYLINFPFDRVGIAPLSTPYTEKGRDLTLVQTDGQLSAAGGLLSFPAQSTPTLGDQGGYYATGLARQNGRVVSAKVTLSTLATMIPLAAMKTAALGADLTNVSEAYHLNAGALAVAQSAGAASIALHTGIASATAYELRIVLYSTGAYFLIKGGVWSSWTLLWVDRETTDATIYPAFSNYNSVGTLDYFRAYDLTGTLASGNKTVNQAAPVNGTGYAGENSGVFDVTVNVPGSGNNAFQFRRIDANNHWRCWHNAAGTYKLQSVVAGVATDRISVARTWAAGDLWRCTIHRGTYYNIYAKASAGAWTKYGAEVNLSTAMDAATEVAWTTSTTGTATRIEVYPENHASYAELDNA